jgi:hypothetical protein
MFILKDGKMVDVLEGSNNESGYIEFFKKNGVL